MISQTMCWKIYYGDGRTYRGSALDQALWAPVPNVQVIAGWGVHRYLLHSRDFYIFRNGSWDACDAAGKADYELMHEGPKAMLWGRSMPRDEDFWALVSRANKERPD